MLASTLWRHAGNRTLDQLEECLLHTFTGDISGNGNIFGFLGDLIDLINIDNAHLGCLDIKICCLDQLEQDVLYIFTYITCLCQCRSICDGKRYAKDTGKCLCQQCLSATGRSQHEDIALLQFHINVLSGCDALVMIIHCDGKYLFCLILTDDIIIQKGFKFLWSQKIDLKFLICLSFSV